MIKGGNRLSIEYVAWVYLFCKGLSGADRHAWDPWLHASQSILQNIAEGNGKSGGKDCRKYFDVARGSGLECASIQDILDVSGVIPRETNAQGKEILVGRAVSMLTKLSAQAMSYVHEEEATYGKEKIDYEHEEITFNQASD